MKKPHLKPGDVLCKTCQGSGIIPNNPEGSESIHSKCNVCHGDGKLDWVENIVGKTPPKSMATSVSASSSVVSSIFPQPRPTTKKTRWEWGKLDYGV